MYIPVGVGVSKPWHHLSGLLFLESASSLLSAAGMSSGGFTSQRGVVFLSFKVGCRQRPLAAAPHCKQKSRCNECAKAGESEQAKCTDVPCVLAVHQPSVVPHNHLQASLFGTKMCAAQRFVNGKIPTP